MKLEYPQYRISLEEGEIVEDWKNSESVPAAVHELSTSANFLFPVKLLKQRKDWQWLHRRTLIAVRTDIYPLIWVYIWFCLQVEWIMYHPWCSFMHFANRIGIARLRSPQVSKRSEIPAVAKTSRGNYYSWKDFLL